MEEFLAVNNLGHLGPIFEEHKITVDILKLLDGDEIKLLIPHIGDRIRFQQALRSQKDQIVIEDNNKGQKRIAQDPLEEEPPDKVQILEPQQNVPPPIVFVVDQIPSTSSDPVGSSSVTDIESTITNLSNSDCGLNSSFLSTHSTLEYNSSEKVDLKHILESDAVGRIILEKNGKQQKLTNTDRGNICDIIISHYLNKGHKLNNESLSFIADNLVQLLPGEKKATYFVDPVPKKFSPSNKPVVAKGKLVDKHRNKLTALRRAQQYVELVPPTEDISLEEVTQNHKDSKIWLQHNCEPSADLLRHWKNSFPIRKKDRITQKTITKFFNEWPILQMQVAVELIQNDFGELFTETKELDFDSFFDNILQKRKDKLSPSENTMLELINDSITTDSKHAIQLHLLPSLIPPKGRTRLKGNKHWKPSIAECRDSLCLHVKTPDEIDNSKKSRIDCMYARGLTVQPYILIVGPNLTNVSSSYVVIDNHTYKTISVLEAIDFCFKVFHVLDIKYPFECQHIWQLLQILAYNLKTKTDIHIPFIQDLM